MVVSSFLLCDQLSERLEPSLFLCILCWAFTYFFHAIKFGVKICHINVYFYRAMLRKAQYCC